MKVSKKDWDEYNKWKEQQKEVRDIVRANNTERTRIVDGKDERQEVDDSSVHLGKRVHSENQDRESIESNGTVDLELSPNIANDISKLETDTESVQCGVCSELYQFEYGKIPDKCPNCGVSWVEEQ